MFVELDDVFLVLSLVFLHVKVLFKVRTVRVYLQRTLKSLILNVSPVYIPHPHMLFDVSDPPCPKSFSRFELQ
jgi:hypothetical protein